MLRDRWRRGRSQQAQRTVAFARQLVRQNQWEPNHGPVYNCTDMPVEWDLAKARLNTRKHGVQFADAVAVLEDERALTTRDPSSLEEQRWVTLGLNALGRVLVVVYTWRGERVRLISARKATARERRRYEEDDET